MSDGSRKRLFGHVTFPILSVERRHAHRSYRRGLQAARIHTVTRGMRARHIEGFDAALRAEKVFGCHRIELISRQHVLALDKPEAVARNDEMQVTRYRTDGAVAIENLQLVGHEHFKGN